MLCGRCMSAGFGLGSNMLGSLLHASKVIPLLVAVIQADSTEEPTVTTASEALWLSMEQSLDCRTDFLQAAGMPALLSRLEHGRRPIRQLAAACIRTSCINCPPNRDAVHEAQVIPALEASTKSKSPRRHAVSNERCAFAGHTAAACLCRPGNGCCHQ